MGSDVSDAIDSLPLAVFLDVWANVYSSRARILTDEEARSLNTAMARSLLLAIDDHFGRQSPTTRSWGWKEPNSIYLLPFLHDQLPEFRFVHLVRDGRDMAFSDNQSQLIKRGRSYWGYSPQRYHGQRERSVALWAAVNSEAAEYGERVLGDKYLRIKFEDLCSDPVSVVSRLYDFSGLTAEVEHIAREEVAPPSSLGRWRQQNPRVLRRIETVAELAPALTRFGYGS